MASSLIADPETSVREIGLRYVDSSQPGFTRHRAGKGFYYRDTSGKKIEKGTHLDRIKALVIPPAWEKVWICPTANGHIQATGFDARGRKQYLYHARWREWRDETKYHHLIEFAETLPHIRQEVDRQLRRPGLPREKVLAAVVSLLEKTLIRIGNESYARENKSFGLTTLRDRHAEVNGDTVSFSFRGKSGIEHTVDLRDRRLARIIKATQDLPGQELVQYLDEEGKHVPVTSDDVNTFLREITGKDFTAKDFRTWGGTVLAASELASLPAPETKTQADRDIVAAIDAVAKQLGNTRAVCRSCYVHPEVMEAWLEHDVIAMKDAADLEEGDSPLGDAGLSPHEQAVLAFLKTREKAALSR
jgi:DNA topoisomerase-1